MPAANRISGSVVPATRRASRTGRESFGKRIPPERASGPIPTFAPIAAGTFANVEIKGLLENY
jgi:hypothetical protein